MEFNFEAVTDNIKETIKKVPTWGWVGIGVGGLALVFLSSRQATTVPGIVEATSGNSATPTGLMGGDSQSLSAGTDGVISQLAQDLNDVVSTNNELETSFNRISNEFVSYQTNTTKVLAETEKNFQTLSGSYEFEKALNEIPAIYYDGKDDAVQYKSLFSAIGTDPAIKTDERERVLDKVAGLGNNGVATKGEVPTLSLAQIKGDKSTLQSEIDRTNRVIENRNKAGLDTSGQVSWLKTLQN